MKMFVLLLLLLSVLIMSGGHTEQAQNRHREREVAKTVERFYSHFSRHEYDKMWNMLSDAVKEGNDNNKASYTADLSRFDLLRLSIEIKDVKISRNRATVTLTKRSWMAGSAKSFSEEHEEVWINQRGQWLFDSSRILSEERESSPTNPSPAVHPKRTGH